MDIYYDYTLGIQTQLSSFLCTSSQVESCGDLTIQDYIIFEQLLSKGNQITFKAKINSLDVIVKFFIHNLSSKNNEFEILKYLQKHSSNNLIFPKPYMKMNRICRKFSIGQTKIKDCYQIIIYEFKPGTELKLSDLEDNSDKIKTDISVFIRELHRMEIIHTDISDRNIIKDSLGNYHLIDYGSAFSHVLTQFPPLQYMLDNYRNGLPSKQGDMTALMCIDIPL
jgi:serine/threonine protein kinase